MGGKVKQPLDFIISALRALGLNKQEFASLDTAATRQLLFDPLEAMGQPFLNPAAPDGWPEHNEKWITPDAMAARIQWALNASRQFGTHINPLALANRSLSKLLSPELERAIQSAPSSSEALTLVFASPEFNRR